MALQLNQELQNKYPHLEISVLKYSDAMTDHDSKRIDSEFFKKDILTMEKNILKIGYKYFSEFIETLTDYTANGSFASLNTNVILYDNENFAKWIRIKDLEANNFDNCRYVDEKGYNFLKKSSLFGGELLISKTGEYLGKAFIVPKMDCLMTLADNIFLIKLKNISNEFLYVYINSKIGQNFISKLSQGAAQPTIIKDSLRKIKIPLFPLSFQQEIEEMVKTSHACLEQSKGLYREAEVLLYRELGLDPENPLASIETHSGSLNISVRPLSQSLNATGRLDSEYYQQKYDEIEKVIKNYRGGYCKLKDIVVNRSGGFAFSSDSYLENGKLALIRINNIKNASLDLQNIVYLPDDAELLSPKDKICKNDILISMSGSIGLCCVIREEINAMVNQRILKISVSKFEENVLCLIINSICCKLQLQRIGTGGVQTNISGDDILNILIPKINPQTQTQIAEKIKQSFTLRKQANELLQQAKSKVETAIVQAA